MGWSNGSNLMSQVIDIIQSHTQPSKYTKNMYMCLIDAFEDFDADCLHECLGENEYFDKAYKEMYPDCEE